MARINIPPRIRRAVIERDWQGCVYCGGDPFADGDIELDHVMPASRGGRDTLDNLLVACRPCNRSKGALLPQEWLPMARYWQFAVWAVLNGVTTTFTDGGAAFRRQLVAQILDQEVDA